MDIPDRLAKHYGLALNDLELRVTECFETSDCSIASHAISIRKKGEDYCRLRLRGCLTDVARTWFLQEIDDRELQFWSLRSHTIKSNKTFQKGTNLQDSEYWVQFYERKVKKATELSYQLLQLCSALHPKTKEIRLRLSSGTSTLWRSAPAPSVTMTGSGSQDTSSRGSQRKRTRRVIED
jgi:hypothetical protein